MRIGEIKKCGACPLIFLCGDQNERMHLCIDGRFRDMEVDLYQHIANTSEYENIQDIANDVLERYDDTFNRTQDILERNEAAINRLKSRLFNNHS